MKTEYQPKTGARCSCKRGMQRDNCASCEGTGMVIDFAAIRTQTAASDATYRLRCLRRKADQAYELAGCARHDGDNVDEARWLKVAKTYDEEIRLLKQ